MSENKLNIYQKLIEVRKSVPGLSKDKENKFFKFAYVSSSQTLAAVRSEMDKQQLLLIPAIIKHETRDHTTKQGGHQFYTELTLEYKWVNAENPTESILCPWAGIGLDESEKGIGKACTYSEKYFLLKFFNVPTDKDDPDSMGNGGSKTTGKTTTTKTTKPKSDKTRTEKVTFIRNCLGDIGRWGFEEQDDGKIIKYKIEKQETINKNAVTALKDITAFPGKNGKEDFTGFDNVKAVEKLQDKWFDSVYGNVKTAHEAWKEKFNNAVDGTKAINEKLKEVIGKEVKDLRDDLPF